mmetsp:Transcript_7455/g.16312  ORF Transcript_7455/g.16312 Transcript_7455/m.16312 type:complete len:731 (-) Transcript_7455:92-2284(-)
MSGWMTGGGAHRKRARAAGASGAAFADDWMEYENDRARGNAFRRSFSSASSSSAAVTAGGGRVRRPAVPGMASTVAPYSPPGGAAAAAASASSGPSGGRGGTNGSSGGGGGGRLNVAKLIRSMQNPEPTVQIAEADASGLSPEQKDVVEAVLSGYSTFFTGPAGSGKSHVLSTIMKLNEEAKYARKKRVTITATTGIAACNVGGITINSFAGVGTGDDPLNEMVARVMGNQYSKNRWKECDVLVIDEVSMMPGQFLDKLNFVAQRARNNPSIFGGLQLLVCGDFFQLPPVNLNKCSFAFEAACWGDVITSSILLKQIFRQNGDQRLMKILNEARVGELSSESAQILRTHSTVGGLGRMRSDVGEEDEIKPTLLESRNAQVDRANAQEMAKLPGQLRKFKSRDKCVTRTYERLLQHCQAPETLELKIGAQVILLKNLEPDKGLVNGSRGVIVDFQLAKNKSDLPREFRKIELPVVRFHAIDAPGAKSGDGGDDDDEGVTKLIEPAEWTNKVGDATVSSRQQIPLRLAWALSVHKSQGMTIPNLAVSLRGVFEYGQAYVALSRATKLDLLTLRGFDERAFKAHPKVKEFYRLLENGGKIDDNEESNMKPIAAGIRERSTSRGSNMIASMHSSNVPQSLVSAASAAASGSTSSTSPPITISNEQRQRMEESRRKALARKKMKQQQANGSSGSASTAGAGRTALGDTSSASNGIDGSRYFAKTTPPNPYNPYQR